MENENKIEETHSIFIRTKLIRTNRLYNVRKKIFPKKFEKAGGLNVSILRGGLAKKGLAEFLELEGEAARFFAYF